MEYKKIIKKFITRVSFGGVALLSLSTGLLLFYDIFVYGYSTIRQVTWWNLGALLFYLFIANIILYADFYYKLKE